MALFGRDRLPDRSTLSRFLASLNQATVEELRTLFQEDLVARKVFASPGGLWDRVGQQFVVVDVDGTRQAARQRALPQLESLPDPHRRFEQAAAPGYLGRKRGEVMRILISTCTERKERRQRQRERMPFLSIRLRQGTKPYHEHYVRTLGGVRRILRLR